MPWNRKVSGEAALAMRGNSCQSKDLLAPGVSLSCCSKVPKQCGAPLLRWHHLSTSASGLQVRATLLRHPSTLVVITPCSLPDQRISCGQYRTSHSAGEADLCSQAPSLSTSPLLCTPPPLASPPGQPLFQSRGTFPGAAPQVEACLSARRPPARAAVGTPLHRDSWTASLSKPQHSPGSCPSGRILYVCLWTPQPL